jgi:hypothetical protein
MKLVWRWSLMASLDVSYPSKKSSGRLGCFDLTSADNREANLPNDGGSAKFPAAVTELGRRERRKP